MTNNMKKLKHEKIYLFIIIVASIILIGYAIFYNDNNIHVENSEIYNYTVDVRLCHAVGIIHHGH